MKKEFTRLIRSFVVTGFSVVNSLPSIIASSFLIICFVGTTILFTSNFLHAVTVNVYPTEDTHIDSDSPNDIYVGDASIDAIKAIYYSFPTDESIALLKFDLTNKIPTGSTVTAATLRLMPFVVSDTTPHIALYKFSNNDWNPYNVTWNNFNAGTYQYLTESLVYEDQYSYWSVLSGLNNGILSLALRSTRSEQGYEGAYFWSLNSYDVADYPVLTINYLPPPICTYTIGSSGATYSASGGSGTVGVMVTDSRCSWTAVSNASWITVTSGSDVTGNGTVVYSVAANTGASRAGTITIAGKTFTINQDAAPCTFGVTPANASYTASGGSGSVNVSVLTGSSCSWTALSNVQWIKVTGGSSGTGAGIMTYEVSKSTERKREGTITIAGKVFTVTQRRVLLPWLPILLE